MTQLICKTCVDFDKIVLSSRCREFKTENFMKKTQNISRVDFFLSKVSQAVILKIDQLVKCGQGKVFKITWNECDINIIFALSTKDKNYTDVIFLDCEIVGDILKNDQRVVRLISNRRQIDIDIVSIDKLADDYRINKLYVVSGGMAVNLPKLNQEQKAIVEIEDEHVVVQGVAGSGKTNICIDKIVFSACRNYKGKVLYSTYSKGLLNMTRLRIEQFVMDLEDFVEKYNSKQVVFLDKDHRRALENKYGIFFFNEDDNSHINKMRSVIKFLKTKVDYLLIEDIYHNALLDNKKFVGERYFVKTYVRNIKNHQVAKELKKLENYSYEVIFKEIFGIIYGFYNDMLDDLLPLNKYIEFRQGSFSIPECNSIYLVAKDYFEHCKEMCLIDTNQASKILLKSIDKLDKYSLSIIDEVQDYTQVNLHLIKEISLKCFCVGDALQMINPSFFSFGYLKNLLYEQDIVSVAELKFNYRNTQRIVKIIDLLGDINTSLFGTHKFVFKGQAIDSGEDSSAVYVGEPGFIKAVEEGKYDNFTIVVSSSLQKDKLKGKLPNQEILTVSEIKGLERDTIVLYNILTDNKLKWNRLENISINKKKADENSLYRYYFNLFYVGVSRARQNLFVVEEDDVNVFDSVLSSSFDNLNYHEAINRLNSIVSKLEFTQDELLTRIQEFISLSQYDNARFVSNKIADEKVREREFSRIDIFETLDNDRDHQDAGIKLWELGLLKEAKDQFVLSGDKGIIELIDACEKQGDGGLGVGIVEYYPIVQNNPIASRIILQTLEKDYKKMCNSLNSVATKLNKLRQGGNYGK